MVGLVAHSPPGLAQRLFLPPYKPASRAGLDPVSPKTTLPDSITFDGYFLLIEVSVPTKLQSWPEVLNLKILNGLPEGTVDLLERRSGEITG